MLDGGLFVDLGCGPQKGIGYLGIDRLRLPGVDIVADLGRGIPLAAGTAQLIRARDFFEHVVDTIAIFNECWRVLVPDGRLVLEVPRFPHVDAVKDPTHVHFFTPETFTEYLCGPDRLEAEYNMRLWDIVNLDAADHRLWATLIPRHK